MLEIRRNILSNLFERTLREREMEDKNHKKSYDLNLPTVSGKFELADSGVKKTNRGFFLGQRHVVTLVGFLCCFFLAANRLALGVGIVAMVKHRQTKEVFNRNESEISCPFSSTPPKPLVESSFKGEFEWSTELQGYLLGIGFLSFLLTQTPAGRLADAIGSKPLLGFTLPATHKTISNWIPRTERGTLSTLVVCGFAAGISVGGMVTGWLCDIPGFGWPSAFYIWGTINVMLAVAIQFICYEYPVNHPWITDEELKYITDGLETKETEKHPPTPWKKIFSSVPSYAYFYGLFGHYWSIAYFSTVHPTFTGTVLHYPMTENGVTSCLPVLMKSVGGVTASIICYWITKKNLIGLNKLRKLTTGVGALGFSLCMAGILLAGCDAIIHILCSALSFFTTGIALSGVMIAGVDMAPVFAGSLVGVANTIAGWSCVLIPVITGLVTTHETLSEWRIVFWINLGVVGSSGLVYVLFGSAEVQP
ncbi:Putative inorganic phosphate cotransporter [Araneus ventricosus]|uniref:Inorganic phosphate cotransporter n=1 Tax=Araneus ventricosus TaxID=182803 RepID=A0A4Y2N3W6_ARAVE|nr:Putative inorganic phosphate cotransporter [Araneus ventricosus]